MYKYDTTGKIAVTLDQLEGQDYFGGAYNKEDRRYWFRLTRHFQNLLIDDTLQNYDLIIYASDPLVRDANTNRVILYGTDPVFSSSPGDKINVQITYTLMQ